MISVIRLNYLKGDEEKYIIKIRYDFNTRELMIKYTNDFTTRFFADVITQDYINKRENRKPVEMRLIEELKIQVRENFESQKETLRNLKLDIDDIDSSIKEFESFNPKHLDRENKLKRILDEDDI